MLHSKLNKETLRKNYINFDCQDYFSSFEEYFGYQSCVSNIELGDQVKLYLSGNSFYSYKKTPKVSAWLNIIGKSDRLVLVGSIDRFGDLYSARDIYPQDGVNLVTNYQDYFCWYVTTSPNIEGRIAELRKA